MPTPPPQPPNPHHLHRPCQTINPTALTAITSNARPLNSAPAARASNAPPAPPALLPRALLRPCDDSSVSFWPMEVASWRAMAWVAEWGGGILLGGLVCPID